MFIVLNVRHCLVEITVVGGDPGGAEAILDLSQELLQHGHSIFSNDYTFHLYGLDLVVPFMISYIFNRESFYGVGI